jgi:tripartite-type tricarboxylate transporter receptor subunit TctC
MTLKSRLIAALALVALLASSAWSQTFPERGKPVTLIIPFPPGGSADFMGRLIAEKLGSLWSVPVVVLNRAGADSLIGIQALATSKNDGYTVALVTNDMVLLRVLREPLPYDSKKDITPVGLIGSVPFVLVTNPTDKINSFKELVDASKRNASSTNYGTCCNFMTLQVERIKALSGLVGTPVPYKGSAPAIVGILSGDTTFVLETTVITEPHIKAGKLTPLAVTTPKRLKSLPDVPTLGEVGLPAGTELSAFYGLVLPGAMAPSIVDNYNDALKQILAMPDVQQKIEGRNVQVGYSSAAEMARSLENEYTTMKDVIQKSGLVLN